MTTKEKWAQIVAQVHSKRNRPEADVQALWENIFVELFGYGRLLGELDRQRIIRIGSRNKVIPDIILKRGNTDLFVAELKTPDTPLTPAHQDQLLSYLKQLQLTVGMLVCNRIALVCYDHTKHNREQTWMEIPFAEECPDGGRLVSLLEKRSFSEAAVRE